MIPEPKIESPFNRFVGAAIDDGLWFALAFYILGYLPASLYDDHPAVVGILLIALVSGWLNYFSICETKWGQTLGKKVMGMRVLAEDGSKAGFGACSIRNILRPVDYLLIGPLMIGSTARHQRLGDKLGKTIVVQERKPRRPAAKPSPPAAVIAPAEEEEDVPLTQRQHPPLPERAVATPLPGGVNAPKERRAPKDRRTLTPTPWSPAQTWRGVATGLLLAAFTPLLVAPFDPDFSSLGATLAAQAILTIALVGTAIYVARRPRERGLWGLDWKSTLQSLGWRRFKGSDLLLAIGALFSYYVAAVIYAVIFGVPHQEDIADQLGLNRGPVLAGIAIFLICVVAPIAEETFFRGMAFAGLRGRFQRLPAALVSGAIFGAVHAPSGPSAVVPLAIFGTVLALLFEQTDSIVPGVFAHVINNSIAIVAGA